MNLDDPESSNMAIRSGFDAVEASCPYGAARGVSGTGESIVWKAIDHVHDPALWFKSKANSYMVSHSSELSRAAVGPENSTREMNLAEAAVVTERRLEQGWEYPCEKGVNRKLAAIERFAGWIKKDVLAEKKRGMAQKQTDSS